MGQKSIFITGITSGIGSVVFQRCLQENFKVTTNVRLESQNRALKETFDGAITVHTVDLSSREQVKKLSETIKQESFDYVVLNAGMAQMGRYHELELDSIDKIINTNLLSNMYLMHAFLPKALERKTKFIFVSSLAAVAPGSRYASYAVSKAALSHFYNCLQTEYPQLPFLCIEIGAVNTPLHPKADNNEDTTQFKSQEEIGNRLYDAILHKTGVQTLAWDWSLIRKLVLMLNAFVPNVVRGIRRK